MIDDVMKERLAIGVDTSGYRTVLKERNRLKASNFSGAQRAFIIEQVEDGTPVAEICRRAGIIHARVVLG
jgi:hypothetical protein